MYPSNSLDCIKKQIQGKGKSQIEFVNCQDYF